MSRLLLLIMSICLVAPTSWVWAQQEDQAYQEEEELPPEEGIPTEEQIEERPVDQAEAEEAGSAAAKPMDKAQYSLGLTYQAWEPFSAVTSNMITETAGVVGLDSNADNASDALRSNEISTETVTIVTFKFKQGENRDNNVQVDLSENSDLSRINPFSQRTEESSAESNLESKLENDKVQTTRLLTTLRLMELPELANLSVQFSEENYVSQVTPLQDTLFTNFDGSEAVISRGQQVQLETVFEETILSISDFTPFEGLPVGHLGYFDMAFQKPILLPLSADVTVVDNGESTTVSSVMIFPRFAAKGWVVEWKPSRKEGFDVSGYIKYGSGRVSIGKGTQRVNELLTGSEEGTGSTDFFSKSSQVLFYGSLLRISYLSDFMEINMSSELRVFTLLEEFNGVKSEEPISVDMINSIQALIHF